VRIAPAELPSWTRGAVRIAPTELPSWTRGAVGIAPTEFPCWTGGAGGGRGQTDDPETQGADASAPPWEMPEGYSWTGTKRKG